MASEMSNPFTSAEGSTAPNQEESLTIGDSMDGLENSGPIDPSLTVDLTVESVPATVENVPSTAVSVPETSGSGEAPITTGDSVETVTPKELEQESNGLELEAPIRFKYLE
jgi:hypothetical protein